ncbi:MAG TPA: Smr/MutS family protein [Xanthobacteraceae bacterium]|nr:Smr/MutS family protein [Xanthobacteraceae bacterium]
MSRRRRLSKEEHALWTGVARSITPLRQSREPASAAAGDSADRETAPPRRAAPQESPAEKGAPPLAPLGRRLKQRVARGREPIDASLDLHGLTQRQAHAELLRFLRRAQADGAKIVLVVTGKGGAKEGREAGAERGVLRRQVPLWLSLPEFRLLVVGFEDAHVGHGGEGALYVRLRRRR